MKKENERFGWLVGYDLGRYVKSNGENHYCQFIFNGVYYLDNNRCQYEFTEYDENRKEKSQWLLDYKGFKKQINGIVLPSKR